VVRRCIIVGGYEDCVDIVRGGDILFDQCTFISNNTKHHFTIKCDVHNIRIEDCTFSGDFKSVWDGAFIDLGNWGTYNFKDIPKTDNIYVTRCNIVNVSWWKQILTRRLFAENPVICDTSGFNLRVPKFIVNIFWLYKRLIGSR